MEKIQVNINSALKGIALEQVKEIEKTEAAAALKTLKDGTGAGNDFLGWLDLPERTPLHDLDEIQAAADTLRGNCDYVVSVGIGGSYLGAKAVIEALNNSFDAFTAPKPGQPKVLFAGQNIGED